MAFRRSGRLIVTRATPSCSSKSMLICCLAAPPVVCRRHSTCGWHGNRSGENDRLRTDHLDLGAIGVKVPAHPSPRGLDITLDDGAMDPGMSGVHDLAHL